MHPPAIFALKPRLARKNQLQLRRHSLTATLFAVCMIKLFFDRSSVFFVHGLHPPSTATVASNSSPVLTATAILEGSLDSNDADFQRAQQIGDALTAQPSSDSIDSTTPAELPNSINFNSSIDASADPAPRYFGGGNSGGAESSDDPNCRKGGELCGTNNNCCSNKCLQYRGGNDANSVCSAGENSCLFGGEPCTATDICCSNKCGINGRCHYGLHSCLFAGQYCEPSRDNTYNGCCGGTCDASTGMCLAGMHICLFGGEKCSTNDQCCSQQCNIGSTNQCAISSKDEGRAQCFDASQWCQRDWQCCSGRCSNYRCLQGAYFPPSPIAACYPAGAECLTNVTCCSSRCNQNRCRSPSWTCSNDDAQCLYDADCCSDRCRNQRCRVGNDASGVPAHGKAILALASLLLFMSTFRRLM